MRIPYAVLAAAGLLLALAPAAGAAQTGRTSEGVRFALDGRVVSLRVPAQTAPGAALEVACGRETRLRDGEFAVAQRTVQPRERVRLRLRGRLPAASEWCAFQTSRPDTPRRHLPHGAAVLHPRTVVPPAPLVPGPGVREGESDEHRPGTRFLLSGRTLTVRFGRPFDNSRTLPLVCGRRGRRTVRLRTVAIGAGRAVVTVEFGPWPHGEPRWCLIEHGVFDGTDVVAASFAAA
jgi:hypothetical protein